MAAINEDEIERTGTEFGENLVRAAGAEIDSGKIDLMLSRPRFEAFAFGGVEVDGGVLGAKHGKCDGRESESGLERD